MKKIENQKYTNNGYVTNTFNTNIQIYNYLRNNDNFQQMINGDTWRFDFRYKGVDIIITRELNYCKYYYTYEFQCDANYIAVNQLMRNTLPKINEILEKKNLEKLVK